MIYINDEETTNIITPFRQIEGYLVNTNEQIVDVVNIEGDGIDDKYFDFNVRDKQINFVVNISSSVNSGSITIFYTVESADPTENTLRSESFTYTIERVSVKPTITIDGKSTIVVNTSSAADMVVKNVVASNYEYFETYGSDWVSVNMVGTECRINIKANDNTIARACTCYVDAVASNGSKARATIIVSQEAHSQDIVQNEFFVGYESNVNVKAWIHSVATYQGVQQDWELIEIKTNDPNILSYVIQDPHPTDESQEATPNFTMVLKPNAESEIRYIKYSITLRYDCGIIKHYDCEFKQEGLKAAIVPSNTIDGLDVWMSANKGDKAVIHYDLIDIIPDSVSFVYDPSLEQVFNISIDTKAQTVTFETKYANESPENDREFTGCYLQGVRNVYGTIVKSCIITIIQSADVASMQFPIWKKEILEIKPIEKYLDYRLVNEENQIIYQGRAYSLDKVVEINLNQLIEPLLNQEINLNNIGWNELKDAFVKLRLQTADEFGEYSDYMTIRTFNDWSYINRDGLTANLSVNVSNVADYRQKLIFTVLDKYGDFDRTDKRKVWLDCDTTDGRWIQSDGAYINDGIKYLVKSNLTGYKRVSLVYAHISDDLYIDGEEAYDVKCTPSKYCLYYRNLFGGYSFLLANPSSTESITTKSTTFTRNAIGFEDLRHETKQYKRTFQHKWSLHTDTLNDEQSKLLKHLFTSNEVYLHDLETDEIYVANITDTTSQIKDFKSNSKKKITYQINCEEAFNHNVK